MVTRVMGKVTETYWSIKENCEEKIGEDGKVKCVFLSRPEIQKEVTHHNPMEICQYEGVPQSSAPFGFSLTSRIFIDGEQAVVEKTEFHADLGEWRQFVDKVVKNIDHNKEAVEEDYEHLIKKYNAYVINGNEKLLSYCKLHNLNIEDTDADELKKVVLGESNQVFTIKYSDIYATNNWATAVINNKLECCCT